MIYKVDSKGKTRFLDIYAEGKYLIQKSGIVGGKVVTHKKERYPKNVGKKNATTAEEQAKLEAANLIKKKLKDGYSTDKNVTTQITPIKPMLANDYFKHAKKLVGKELAIQPKLDGVRCMLQYDSKSGEVKAISRSLREFDNINIIKAVLKDKLIASSSDDKDIMLDGELYVHGNTFQENTTLVKNKLDPKNHIEYHVYDIIDTSLTFKGRNQIISDILDDNDEFIKIVPTKFLQGDEDLDEEYSKYISDGYEGMMVRVADSKYKVNARSMDLLKYKKFIDIALPIESITVNDANPKHGTVWVKYKGHLQKTGSKLSHADREDLLFNKRKYIGKTAEIRFFEETDAGKMRFAYYHGLRLDK